MGLNERLGSLSRPRLVAVVITTILAIGFLDYITGYDISLDVFYLFPLAFAAWYLGANAGVFFSLVTMLVITLSNVLAGKEYSRLGLEIWNTSIRFGFYVTVSVLLSRLRSTMQQRSRLIIELQETLKEVKELRGILPICSSCKKIRTDEGYWQNVDEYLSHHTNAEFTHGLCKECAAKLYPDYYQKIGKGLGEH